MKGMSYTLVVESAETCNCLKGKCIIPALPIGLKRSRRQPTLCPSGDFGKGNDRQLEASGRRLHDRPLYTLISAYSLLGLKPQDYPPVLREEVKHKPKCTTTSRCPASQGLNSDRTVQTPTIGLPQKPCRADPTAHHGPILKVLASLHAEPIVTSKLSVGHTLSSIPCR